MLVNWTQHDAEASPQAQKGPKGGCLTHFCTPRGSRKSGYDVQRHAGSRWQTSSMVNGS